MNDTYNLWLKNIKDKKIVKKLKKLTNKQIEQNFYKSLNFGTAGMRGTMEFGTNNLNELTVCKLAESLAKYIDQNNLKRSVVVCFDTRFNSKKYSRIFANVLAYQDITVHLFKKFAPTPLCVFATSTYETSFGVMITASHNNKNYNGIKVYDHQGIQINKQTQEGISEIFEKIDEISVYNNIFNKKLHKNIQYVQKNILEIFTNKQSDYNKKTLNIVYTPLNGTGYHAVKRLLHQNGFKFKSPKSQKKPNGYFKTCPYPNPEFIEAFNQSLIVAKKQNADLIVATDPDADRIGIMVKHNNQYVKLSGNEVGYIFAEDVIQKHKQGFIVTTVVTSPLIDEICKKNNIQLYKTLTGFMSLGTVSKNLVKEYGQDKYLLSYEESCGYVVRNDYYDKDGIYATLKICDIAEKLKTQNKTLVDYLNEIYAKYGYITTLCESIMFEGADSLHVMNNKVEQLRENSINTLLNKHLIQKIDYKLDDTGLEKQNFIEYRFEDFTFIIRPSGTEPKLKIYIFAKGNNLNEAQLLSEKVMQEIKTKILK